MEVSLTMTSDYFLPEEVLVGNYFAFEKFQLSVAELLFQSEKSAEVLRAKVKVRKFENFSSRTSCNYFCRSHLRASSE